MESSGDGPQSDRASLSRRAMLRRSAAAGAAVAWAVPAVEAFSAPGAAAAVLRGSPMPGGTPGALPLQLVAVVLGEPGQSGLDAAFAVMIETSVDGAGFLTGFGTDSAHVDGTVWAWPFNDPPCEPLQPTAGAGSFPHPPNPPLSSLPEGRNSLLVADLAGAYLPSWATGFSVGVAPTGRQLLVSVPVGLLLQQWSAASSVTCRSSAAPGPYSVMQSWSEGGALFSFQASVA